MPHIAKEAVATAFFLLATMPALAQTPPAALPPAPSPAPPPLSAASPLAIDAVQPAVSPGAATAAPAEAPADSPADMPRPTRADPAGHAPTGVKGAPGQSPSTNQPQ